MCWRVMPSSMVSPDGPPVEWVRGTRLGAIWTVVGISAVVAAYVFLVYPGLNGDQTSTGLYGLVTILAVVLVNLVWMLAFPLNLRIGISPVSLVARFPIRTVSCTRDFIWWSGPTALEMAPPGHWSVRVVLTPQQASRLASIWGRP